MKLRNIDKQGSSLRMEEQRIEGWRVSLYIKKQKKIRKLKREIDGYNRDREGN